MNMNNENNKNVNGIYMNDIKNCAENIARNFNVFVNVTCADEVIMDEFDIERYYQEGSEYFEEIIECFEECMKDNPDMCDDYDEIVTFRDYWENEIDTFNDNIEVFEDIIIKYGGEDTEEMIDNNKNIQDYGVYNEDCCMY